MPSTVTSPKSTPKEVPVVLTILKTMVLLAAMPIIFLGVPYLWRVVSNPWCWSLLHKDSLTGIWVGTLHRPVPTYKPPPDPLGKLNLQEELDRLPKPAPKTPEDLVIIMRPHLQFFAWLAHLAGSAETCEAGGKHLRLRFTMGDFEQGKINVILGNPVDPVKGGGRVEGTQSNEVLAVSYQTDNGNWEGTLHKGTTDDFQRSCSGLVDSTKP